MVSSLLGDSPLKVDAIPTSENSFVPYARPSGGTCDLNYNNSSNFFPEAGRASMDAGCSIVNILHHQTVNPSGIQVGSRDSTGVSLQPENPKPPQDTTPYLGEPFGDTFFTPDDLGATGFAHHQGAPIGAYSDMIGAESEDEFQLSHDTMVELADLNDFWFKQDGKEFRCNICETTLPRLDNLKRHLRKARKCKTAWERLDEAAKRSILCTIFLGIGDRSRGRRILVT
ncbi:hypothetical protein CDEST_12976 [Colletotrichum destructivum]|uniref:C2H2-type domain-containing protein n=1 Tax=Colletotrichum destructivum TaxID=34406 RepID=A0AAX4IXY2_9PEZI|nr:hypothetical protein CDEST_12976 [Colletotrichum destructivum]